ncbi:hypothetical protein AB0M20_37505 [Actinoplanes sp. NPDC051633]|uniref:hypothetical protein n=1 Tax=Actinoplanes sp. NPDC051633 TaxID=3155670 RepID=UPI003429FF10
MRLPARLEKAGIAAAILVLVALPTAVHGWPRTLAGNLFTAMLLASGQKSVLIPIRWIRAL